LISTSIIITTYKDPQALSLILDSLRLQTHKVFEVVIAEDEQSEALKELLKEYSDLSILHLSQEDLGRRKLIIQNRAILEASGEYLIFIDGDCLLYSTFIEGHLSLAKKRRVLTGRRINLSENISAKIRANTIQFFDIERYYTFFAMLFMFDKSVRVKQGFYLKADGWLYKLLNRRKRTSALLGSNFSCYKEDFISINGFDEGFGDSIIGQEDTDIDWRFKASGCEMYSAKNRANMMHLYHPFKVNREWSEQDKIDYDLMMHNKQENIFTCKQGLQHYND